MLRNVFELVLTCVKFKRILWATTIFELKKKYAGTFLGYSWLVLYPLLFLSVYLFLWLVVFKTRFPGYSEVDYVVFVFSGLVPYLFVSEVATTAVVSIRQNMHLIKNVMIPISLVPIRVVGMALASMLVGLLLLLFLSGLNGTLAYKLFYLIFFLIFTLLFALGLALFLAPLGVLIPDASNIVNLVVLLMMFLSPIAFKIEMVPSYLKYTILFNPITYIMEPFRAFIISSHALDWRLLLGSFLIAVATFLLGVLFFSRFKKYMVDYE